MENQSLMVANLDEEVKDLKQSEKRLEEEMRRYEIQLKLMMLNEQ